MYSGLTEEEMKKIAQEARAKVLADVVRQNEINRIAKNAATLQADRIARSYNANNDLGDALAYGAKTGINTIEHGLKSAALSAAHTGANALGLDAAAQNLGSRLKQQAQEQAKDQAAINSQYNTNFGLLGRGVSDVTSGAIGMLPTVGAFALTPQGKIAAAGKAAQLGAKALGFTPMALQAAGGGINQALNEGASIEEAKKYGAGTALKEVATELPFAGIAKLPGMVNLGSKVAGNKIASGLINAGTEGAEEMLATVIEPYIKRATYNPDAENADVNEVLWSGLIGAGTAGAINSSLAGAGKVANMAQNTVKQPKNALENADASQNAENSLEQEIISTAIKNTINGNKVSQNQSSQADFLKNTLENVIEQNKAQNMPKISLEMSERNFDNVADKNVKAYQQENPAIKPFQQETANNLLADLQMGIKGGIDVGIDPETRNVTTRAGWQREQSEPIERMLDDGLSYKKIEDGLNRIIEDHGKENTPNAKRVELYVYDAMMNGYNSVTSGRVDTNRNYAISNMSLEELEAEAERLSSELANTTDEFKLEEMSAQLDNIQKRMDLLRKDISPTLDRPAQPEIEPEPIQYQDYDLSKLSKEVYDFYNNVGKVGTKAGFDVRVVDGIENDANGRYDGKGGIIIDGNKMTDEATISRVVGHEVYHFLKDTDEHKYIIDRAIESSGKAKEQLVKEKMAQYARAGVTLDRNSALDEIGAEFMEQILSNPKLADRIWTDNPTLAQRIMWWLEDMVNRFRDKENNSEIYRKALDAYSRGLRNMQRQNANTGEARYAIGFDGDKRYSLPKMPNQKYLAESDENLKAFMYGSQVVNEDGSPKVVYSGHGNTNLFGSSFDKKRATAGGFYFTANPDIASNYAKDKLGVKEYYENGDEYRIKDEKGKYKLQLRDIYLTDEQAAIFDEWLMEDLGWTFEDFKKERSSYDYRYRYLSKRRLADLYWFMNEFGYTLPQSNYTKDGVQYSASEFENLMDAMGVEWDSYTNPSGGVFPVYLAIRNPIDTSKPFPEDVMKRLERLASRERRMSYAEIDEAHWTKDYPVYQWIDDIKRMEETGEETYWATQVPTKARKILQEMGYDGIKDTGGKMGGEEHEVWIAFEPTQIKSAIGNRGTFDPTKKDLRYSIGDMVNEYGAITKGENPLGTNRDIDVPQQTADNNRVNRFARTVVESANVDDTTVNMVMSDMENGRFTYTPSGNQEQVERANALINHTGWEQQLEQFQNKYRSGQAMTADNIVLGERLILEAQSHGDYQTAVDLIADVAAIGTELGRAVQALSVLKRLSPEGKVKALKRVEQRINAGLIEQGRKPVQLNNELLGRMLQAESQQMQSEIWDACVEDMANQVPATLVDKINAWRYLAMLSNPKTHIRNLLGNSVMLGVSSVKRGIQTKLEGKLLTAGEERYATLNKKVPKEYFDFAQWSWDNEGRERAKAGGGRYNDAISQIEQNKRIFDNNMLETARKTNTNALEGEDMWFKKKTYIDALARYMYVNGLIPNAIQNTANNATYNKGVDYALKEAYKGTFQEASKVANLLSQMENSSPAAKVIMGALVPFKKTPINILKRGVEYSPVGLMNGLYKMLYDVQTGKKTKAEAIDSIAAGLTGTGIMVLGYFMASLGRITAGAGEDDERKQWYDQQMGSQNFALVLPNGATATIDWLAPSVMPLMAGAELYHQMVSENPDNANSSVVTNTLEAISKVANPVLEMSMLQGVTGALQSYNSGTTGVLSDLLSSTATSYGGQFIPAPMSALARTIDSTVRSSYAPKDSAITKTGEKFIRQQVNKLPFASMANEASIDVWGNERKREGDTVVGRAIHNFINPSTYSSDKRTALDRELESLYEQTGDSGVLPKMADNYLKVDGKTYYKTAEEKTRYDKTKGQKSQKYVSAFVNSKSYKTMSSTEKAEVIADLYSLANYEAKKEMLTKRGYDYSDKNFEKVLKSKISPVDYYTTEHVLDYIADNVGKGQKDVQIEHLRRLKNEGAINDEQYWYLRKAMIGFSKAEAKECPYKWIVNI